uniref:Inositol-1-monophosphatase n=1 Tax=Thermosphaera aggregans TaxID=54254 RepID=A0A7C2BKW5_9CREN
MENARELFKIIKRVSESLTGLLRQYYGDASYSEVVGLGVTGDTSRRIDIVAEEHAVEELRRTGLEVWVVSEERGLYRLSEKPDYIVLIDPLDGSLNYSIGVPFASVSLALFPYKKLNPQSIPEEVVGVVENIFTREWYGVIGHEVYVEGRLVNSYPMHRTGIASVYFDTIEELKSLRDFFRNRGWNLRLRVYGSASLESAYASVGKIDHFISLTKKLRNTDIVVGYVIASRLGAGITGDVSPSKVFTSNVVTVGRIAISPPERLISVTSFNETVQ